MASWGNHDILVLETTLQPLSASEIDSRGVLLIARDSRGAATQRTFSQPQALPSLLQWWLLQPEGQLLAGTKWEHYAGSRRKQA